MELVYHITVTLEFPVGAPRVRDFVSPLPSYTEPHNAYKKLILRTKVTSLTMRVVNGNSLLKGNGSFIACG